MAQGEPFERSQLQGNASQNEDVVAHFLEAAATGRGNCIDDTVYIEIEEAERRAFPRLAGSYGVAIRLPAVDGERVQCFVFQTESEFDDEVLAALSGLGCSAQPRAQ